MLQKQPEIFLYVLDLNKFKVKSKEKFNKALNEQTNELKRKLPDGAQNWGTARKALNVFLEEVFYNRILAAEFEFLNLENYLELPLDSKTVKCLKQRSREGGYVNNNLGNFTIRGLTLITSNKYQELAEKISKKEKVSSRIYLDLLYWGR